MKIEPRHDKRLPAYAVGISVLAAATILTGCPRSSLQLEGETTDAATSAVETDLQLEGEETWDESIETAESCDTSKINELITDGIVTNDPPDEFVLEGGVAIDQIEEYNGDDSKK